MSIIFLLLSYYIIDTFSNMTISKELEYNSVVLSNTNEYMKDKFNIVNTISMQLYYDKFNANSKYLVESTDMNKVFDFLQNNMSNSSLEYLETKQVFDSYFSSVFSRDESITGISIYKLADSNVYQYTRLLSDIYPKDEYKFSERLKQIEDPYKPTIKIYPAAYPEYYDFSHDIAFTLAINLKSADLNRNVGVLMVDFNVKGIDRLISKLNSDSNNEIILLSADHRVIYDSSGIYGEQPHPFTERILHATGIQKINIDGKNYLLKKLVSPDSNITLCSFISVDNLLSKVKDIKYSILLALLMCILACSVLMTAGSQILSKRIKVVVNKIQTMKKGDLTVRLPVTKSEDELDAISLSFNQMSEDLSSYIENAYVMELKQKSAELTALQSQINPHFLYNTLEAIRMKALKNGDTDVSKMIYTLAKLFRSSIKDQTIIRIEDEIKYVELYLSLFKIRYENNFSYRLDIDRDILEYGIPKLLLQPIVENYIVHGFDARSNSFIHIKAARLDGQTRFEIEDNGKGICPEKLAEVKATLNNPTITSSQSIGLLNVNERIKLIFGSQYGLEVDSTAGTGTRVMFNIPSVEQKELKLHVQGIDR